MNVFSACAFAVAAALSLSVIRRIQPEISSVAAAVAVALLATFAVKLLTPAVKTLYDLSESAGCGAYFDLLLKSLAVSVCCRISADICADCGEKTIGEYVTVIGKITLAVISLPTVRNILLLIKDMLG